MTASRIRNPSKMKQLIDFKNLDIDGYIYPTDIDGIIEYKDSEYIIFEVKYGDTEVPIGQKLALKRMVDDFTKIGKQAIVLICEHRVSNYKAPIVAANCKVREIYYGEEKKWRKIEEDLSVKTAVELFQKYSQKNLGRRYA